MNTLATLTDKSLTMSSREIAELTGKEHRNVMRDIRTMLVELHGEGGVLSFEHTYRNAQNGQEYPVFLLPKRETLILVSGYSIQMRARIIDRWQELESMIDQPKVPQTMPEALRLAAEAIEERDRLALENKVQAEALAEAQPKAQGFDLITAGEKSITIRETAKLLGIKENRLTAWLHENGWTYRMNGRWVAKSEHIQGGRLIYKEARYTDQNTGQEVYAPYCHVTPKGLAKLARVFGAGPEHQLASAA
jgi:Rha family phage regulatory protein